MAMRYRFEWFKGESLERTAEAAAVDSIGGGFAKGEAWRVRVTPLAEDDRVGPTTEAVFTVANTPPTLVSAALSTYTPLSDERVRLELVAFDDADGDASASTVRWTIGDRLPIEGTSLAIDLAAISPPIDPGSEELTIQVIPGDGEDDNEGEAISIGPLTIADGSVTRWRELAPDHNTLHPSGGMITWDPRHRRFLFSGDGDLWEYSTELGFTQLPDPGPFLLIIATDPVFDATPGAERVLLAGWKTFSTFAVYALDVSVRGKERWEELPVEPVGPALRCLPSVHFDSDARHFLMHGGWIDGPCNATGDTTNELWILDMSDPTLARWVGGTHFSSTLSSAGGSMVENPVAENSVLIFGGFADESTSPVATHKFDYDLTDPSEPKVSYTNLGNILDIHGSGVRAPLAIVDSESDKVVLGLGLDGELAPVERVWTYTVDAAGGPGTLRVQNTDLALFDELDTVLGSANGSGGWHNGRIVFWPGVASGFLSTFRLGEVLPQEGEDYLWRSVYRASVHFSSASTQAARDGSLVVVTTSDARGRAATYDLDAQAWRFDLEPQAPPLERKLIQGGQTVDGGLWVLGGRVNRLEYLDMQPYSYLDGTWTAPTVAGTVPERRAKHVVFDTGCGEDFPMGFYGGQRESDALSSDDTWLLSCPSEASECAWNAVGGGTHGAFRDAAGAFDGIRYVVVHGGVAGNAMMGFTSTDEVHYLDVCAAPELGWQLATMLPDPVYGVPALAQHSMVRISAPGDTPEFLIAGGSSATPGTEKLWRLREVGDGQYAWLRVAAVNAPPVEFLNLPVVWDPAQDRLIVFHNNSLVNNGNVHELRLRD